MRASIVYAIFASALLSSAAAIPVAQSKDLNLMERSEFKDFFDSLGNHGGDGNAAGNGNKNNAAGTGNKGNGANANKAGTNNGNGNKASASADHSGNGNKFENESPVGSNDPFGSKNSIANINF